MLKVVPFLLGLIPCLVAALDAPDLEISATMTDGNGNVGGDSVYVDLSWSPVPGAIRYNVYYKHLLTNPPLLLGHTTTLMHETAVPTEWGWPGSPDVLGFFMVEAESLTAELPDVVSIPAGNFVMGQIGVANPEHQVTLTHDFFLGGTEVTNQQYLEALTWAQAMGLVTVVGDYVQQYGVNLLQINHSTNDWCEIRFDAGTQDFYLHAGTHVQSGAFGPGFAYPSGYDPADHPVKWVSWYGAACYCDWLSQMNGLPAYYNGNWSQTPSPNNPYAATGYRLPTEAEWEFAAQYDVNAD